MGFKAISRARMIQMVSPETGKSPFFVFTLLIASSEATLGSFLSRWFMGLELDRSLALIKTLAVGIQETHHKSQQTGEEELAPSFTFIFLAASYPKFLPHYLH